MSALLEVDYYAVLEIDEKAGSDDIKRAYRRLSLLKHPDKNSGNPNAHEAFCALNEAYDTLKDASRRILYDVKYPKIKQKWDDFRRSKESERARTDRQENAKSMIGRLFKEYMEVQAASVKRVEKLQEEIRKMAQIREDIAKKEMDIEHIRQAGKERSRLEKQGDGWFRYLTSGWGRTAADIEKEKVKREQEILQKLASERIKIELLEGQKRRLQQSEQNQLDQVHQCENQDKMWKEKVTKARNVWQAEDNKRIAEQRRVQEEERKKRERERLAREAKEAAERKKATEERDRLEKERQRKQADELREFLACAEKARKARAEKLAATEREAAARMAKERMREAEEKLQREQRRARMFAESRTSSGGRASWTEARQGTRASMPGRSTRSHNNHNNTRPKSNAHPGRWLNVQGSNYCSVCAQKFYLFILQCPQCDKMACASCKRMAPGPCEREEVWDYHMYDYD